MVFRGGNMETIKKKLVYNCKDEIIGVTCNTCDEILLFGDICKKCRWEEEKHQEILEGIKSGLYRAY